MALSSFIHFEIDPAPIPIIISLYFKFFSKIYLDHFDFLIITTCVFDNLEIDLAKSY